MKQIRLLTSILASLAVSMFLTACQSGTTSGSTPRPHEKKPDLPRGVKVTYFAHAKGTVYKRMTDTYLILVSPTWAENHSSLKEPFQAIKQPLVQITTEKDVQTLLTFMTDNGFYTFRVMQAVDVAALQRATETVKIMMLEAEGETRIVSSEYLTFQQRAAFRNIEAAFCMAFNTAPSLASEVRKDPVLDAFREYLRKQPTDDKQDSPVKPK